MSKTVYVIDTSYLLELYAVPGFSSQEAVREVRRRYQKALEEGNLLFVPLGCIYELGNRIADVGDGNRRRELTVAAEKHVTSSVESGEPWTITPVPAVARLPELMEAFRSRFVQLQIGLTDTHVIREAEARSRETRSFGYKVHIWTKDKRMKSYEPDMEESPFLG